ncbi:MAG: hypothetical protein V2I41_08230 [Pseudomonadales bacterium]|nr:hypothetical protein [Pseudomonadales bacterium]
MNHFMLPGTESESQIQSNKEVGNTARYGIFAMEALIASLLNPGGTAADLEAKVFGGARVVELSSEIGTMNIVFALKYLRDQKINIVAKDVGADYPRKLIYDPKTGITKMQRLRSAYRGYVAQNERRNLDNLIASPKPPGKAT